MNNYVVCTQSVCICFIYETAIIYLNSVTQLIVVTVKCGVLFEVRTEFLNII
jgi:hypothetical protein